jgi:hypothetical protein
VDCRDNAAATVTPACSSRAKGKGSVAVAAPSPIKSTTNRSVSPGQQCKRFTSGQHVQSGNCCTADYEEFIGAVSEEQKILAITKIVLNLMKQNGQ